MNEISRATPSAYPANHHSAWTVDFFYGGVSAYYSKVFEGCVRLARSGW